MAIVKLDLEHTDDTANWIDDSKGTTGRVRPEITVGNQAMGRTLAQLSRLNQDRRANFTYHAFGKTRGDWTIEDIKHIQLWCTKYNLSLAIWENSESATQLFCIKDPDIEHEDAGRELYQYMQGHYQSYGHAHWTEWESWGIEIDINIPVGLGVDDRVFVLATIDGKVAIIS